MSKLIKSLKFIIEFVTVKLWKIRLNKINTRHGKLLRQLRVFALSFKGFKLDNCLTSATALTYYTLFSIVPVLALLFAIAKGFGYEKDLQEQILKSNQQYAEILNNAFTYANSMLANTRGGVIAGIGIMLLLWSVMKLLMSIEDSFNTIWEVQRGRSWVRKITDYLTIMLVGPLMLILSGGINVFIQSEVDSVKMIGFAEPYLIKLFALCLVAVLFTFIYIALPNTKVHYPSAFKAGFIAAFLFEILSWGYVKFQVGANSLNAIYGGFAALPLFLIWIQYSWYVVLFGAELAYSYENVDHYELEEDIQKLSLRYRKGIAVLIANLVAKRFYEGDTSLTAKQISEKLDLPIRLTKMMLNDFVETAIFVEVKTDVDNLIVYQPGVTESRFTVKYVLDALEAKGLNSLPITESYEMSKVTALLNEIDANLEANVGHLQIKDVTKA